jgi:hypothetical protein
MTEEEQQKPKTFWYVYLIASLISISAIVLFIYIITRKKPVSKETSFFEWMNTKVNEPGQYNRNDFLGRK